MTMGRLRAALLLALVAGAFPQFAQRPGGTTVEPRIITPPVRQPIRVLPPVRGGASDEAALLARLGTPAQGPLPGGAGSNPFIAVTANGGPVMATVRCASGSRSADKVSLTDAGNAYVVTFSCRGDSIDDSIPDPTHQGSFSVVLRKGDQGPLAAGSGPRKLLPGDAPLEPQRSRGWAEMQTCLSAFDQYRGDTSKATFDVKVVAGYPRCSANASFTPLTLLVTPPISLANALGAFEIERFGPYLSTKDPNGENVYGLYPVLWRNDYNDARVAIVTSGKPFFNAVRLAPYTATSAGDVSCANWQQQPGLLTAATLPVSDSRKAYKEEVSQMSLGDINDPWVSTILLNAAMLDAMKSSLPGGNDKLSLRLIPMMEARPKPAYCVGRPSAALEVNFGTSPGQKANAEIAAQIQASQAIEAAKKKAAQQAEAARAQFFGGQNPADRAPVRVSIISYEPPFGTRASDNTTYLMTSIPANGVMGVPSNGPRKTTFTLDESLGSDLVWPNRAGWSEGCSFDPYYFVQAAQHEAKPTSVLDWIVLTLNSYSGIYKMLQNFVVEGFAYVTTGGACPFNDPNKPDPDSGACKAYKTVAKTALKVGMSAIGAPSDLPSANDITNMGADYVASTAVNYVAGADVSGYIPDSVRQAASKTISDGIKKEVLGAKCTQPLQPGQDPKAHGFDGVDPVTMCGYKLGSLFNFTRRDTWSDGHPHHAVVYLRVSRNPNGIMVDPTVKIALTTAFSSKPPVPSWLEPHLPLALRPFGSVPTITLDVRNVPQGGMTIPVLLPYDESEWKFTIGKTIACGNDAFRPQCLTDNAFANWRKILKNPARIAADVTYTWTADPSATTSCMFVKDANGKPVQVCGTAPATVTATASALQGPPERTFAGKMASFPSYKPCPGFKLVAPDPVTGVQTGAVVPAFNMDDL